MYQTEYLEKIGQHMQNIINDHAMERKHIR
jgi:hypothetical protein